MQKIERSYLFAPNNDILEGLELLADPNKISSEPNLVSSENNVLKNISNDDTMIVLA